MRALERWERAMIAVAASTTPWSVKKYLRDPTGMRPILVMRIERALREKGFLLREG